MPTILTFLPIQRVCLASILLLLTWQSVLAQTSQPSAQKETPQSTQTQNSDLHSIRVRRITDPIKIDGRLDEPVWTQADIATDFRQQEPNEGAPASERS